VTDSAGDDSNLGAGDVVFAIVLIVAAGLLALAHLTFVGLSCTGDTSECAHSIDKDGFYAGSLRYPDGRPYRSAEFELAFATRDDRPHVPFETDAEGRYCVVWANERVYPSASTPSGEELLGNRGSSSLGPWEELNGRDPPPGCHESNEGVPWNRADDAEQTWQSRLLTFLPLASIAVLLAALAGRRTRYALRLFLAGGLLFAADLVAFVLLWFLQPLL
jgi:hypothetical protein